MRTHRTSSDRADAAASRAGLGAARRRPLSPLLGVLTAVTIALTGSVAAYAESESPAATGGTGTDREVTFTASDGLELHGSLRVPTHARKPVPAVLLIAGSGPTDREGNSSGISGDVGTLRNLADTLARNGIASLRYDKLGSGQTGMGPYAEDPGRVDFDAYVEHAAEGLRFLADQPEVNQDRLMVTGHSEGGLIALVLAQDETLDVPPISSVGLLTPASLRYLTTITNQLTAQLEAGVEAGVLPREEADALLASLEEIVESLRTDGRLPDSVPPELASLFNPYNERFLHNADQYDPSELAATLPTDVSVYLACATADIQVACSDVDLVRAGLAERPAGHTTNSTLYGVNHVLKEVGSAGSDGSEYGEPLPFSRQLRIELSWFVFTQLHLR
ncbi:Alpha/beta hydrolase family [Actinoalloteichus fjordicus]|uniref:Alpha/beta hydrolase family n=1 Tax=Actinoalloteichus fjordicus TaxID=1612552 RepID=A0AAC9LA08_9PSEU|nr:Alpha/beta hydrolase family [Actinoalloteichus fjordicus]